MKRVSSFKIPRVWRHKKKSGERKVWARITGVRLVKVEKRQRGFLCQENGCETPKGRAEGSEKDMARARERCEQKWSLKEIRARERERERKDTGREKVRWRDEKCSGRGGIYVRVSLAQQGCLLKGSLLRTGGEKGCGYKDGWLNKEPQIALLDCPENQVLKMNFQKTQNYSWLIYQSIQKKKTLNLFPANTTNRLC